MKLMGVVLVVALMVWVGMGRPVIFRHERAGWQERPFTLLKFRTMRLGEGSDIERLTPFGRWLRRCSLDELPQLVNVLRGEMALVGPRPLPVRYLPHYSPEQRRRHEVRPGITGWAQVRGRNAVSWGERLALDVWYVEQRSWWLDMRILALTVAAVFSGRGVMAGEGETMGDFCDHSVVAKK